VMMIDFFIIYIGFKLLTLPGLPGSNAPLRKAEATASVLGRTKIEIIRKCHAIALLFFACQDLPPSPLRGDRKSLVLETQ
ncbi:MAG: hypothetical protein K2N86_01840, partial [Rikenellaceae bacterium]|nr:hypothetical protein [Rikenellaceae bacterium]